MTRVSILVPMSFAFSLERISAKARLDRLHVD
jgi:hypothetical protein